MLAKTNKQKQNKYGKNKDGILRKVIDHKFQWPREDFNCKALTLIVGP